MTTTEKPKRKRRTKAEIAADKLKAKKELFDKEYLPLGIPVFLTVQQTAKVLKATVKETREKCVNGLFVCQPHESEKNQWNIDTYQFIEEEHFEKFVKYYLRQLDISKVIITKNEEPKISVETKKTRTVKKEPIKEQVEQPDEKVEEKDKRKKTTKTKKVEVINADENQTITTENKPKRATKKKPVKQEEIQKVESTKTLKTETKKEEPQKKLSPKEKEQNSRLEGFIQKKQRKPFELKPVYEVPIVPEHAHYSVNDKVKLLSKFVVGEDCDEETLEYMDYYKKHLYGKQGVITKIEFAAKGHIVYTVYFEKYKEEMYCYHHYLEWLS